MNYKSYSECGGERGRERTRVSKKKKNIDESLLLVNCTGWEGQGGEG